MSELLTRAFIAIELRPEIRRLLHNCVTDLRKFGADVKWVEPDNIHLTLKFLGEISTEMSYSVQAALAETAQKSAPFPIDITHLDAFPDKKRARILWAGITRNADRLASIAASIEEKLASLGIPPSDHPFHAHVTLGRVRSPENIQDLSTALAQMSLPPMEQTVEGITLFKSTLTPPGPVYTAWQKYDFLNFLKD